MSTFGKFSRFVARPKPSCPPTLWRAPSESANKARQKWTLCVLSEEKENIQPTKPQKWSFDGMVLRWRQTRQ